jgi:hypothetical protein
MAAWIDNTAGTGGLDALLDTVSSRAAKILLVTSFTPGETYATVVGRSVGEAAITSGDFSGPVAHNTNDRKITFTGASGTASQPATGPHDLHMVITNGTDTLLAISDETSDQDIVSGNTINWPSFEIRALQPTSVP